MWTRAGDAELSRSGVYLVKCGRVQEDGGGFGAVNQREDQRKRSMLCRTVCNNVLMLSNARPKCHAPGGRPARG